MSGHIRKEENTMKDKLNRILSLAITIVMIISSFSMTAFAESRTTHTYELYQIFTGTFSDGVLSDVKWGQNAKKPVGQESDVNVNADVLKELEALSTAVVTDSQKLATITNYVNFESAPYKGVDTQPTKAQDSNQYTYSGIEPGYYIIKDAANTQDIVNGVYTLYVAQASDTTLVFTPKESIPTVTKQINDGTLTSTNEASIGDVVNYVITGTLPSQIADYATYYYKFTDTLSKGLTYTANSLKVYLKNADSKEDVTQYFYVNAGQYNEATGTSITVAIQDLKALAKVQNATYTVATDTQVIIEYTATLNQNAVVNAANTNEVNLTYSNDPNNSGTPAQTPPTTPPDEPKPTTPVGETVKSTTETYTTALVITKKNDQGAILQGAEFTLTGKGVNQVLVMQSEFQQDSNGTYYKLKDGTYTETEPEPTTSDNYVDETTKYSKTTKTTLKGSGLTDVDVKGEVDATGVVTFTGLGAGEYTLTETKTPAGYNTMDPITFNISFDAGDKKFSTDNIEITLNEMDGKLYTEIVNYPGSKLPSTGGIGTTIFYVAGSALAIGAIVLLVVKKRMDDDNR